MEHYAAERTPPFPDSMDGTGEYYAKWNKPGSERQMPYDLSYKRNLMIKQTRKIEPEAWKQGTEWHWPEWREVGQGRKKGKCLVKQHV